MRDIYLDTRDAYIEGKLHTLTAIALLATDRTFLAESELAHGPGNAPICAHHVVLGPWLKRRVAMAVATSRAWHIG